jgi:hypothetical protein
LYSLGPNPARGRFREADVSTDTKGTKILARTFFNQLRGNGYSPTQIIGVASELIDLVTCDLRDGEKAQHPLPAEPAAEVVREA